MLYVERKIEFGREKVQRKNRCSRDGNSEKSELVDTSCKSNEVSQNGLGDTTCILRRPFQIPEQPTVEKLFKVITKHKRV